MSKLISSEDIRENGTPWPSVAPLTGTRHGSLTWLGTCYSTNSQSPLWFSSNPSTSKPLISSSWWPFCDSTVALLSLFHRWTQTDLMFQASAKSPDLKKTGKAPRAQASVKEVGLPANSSNAWNRPRCGVPDYPAQKEVHYRVRNRQRRFVLYGGRLDRTDLTYRYRQRSQDQIFFVMMWIHHSFGTEYRLWLISESWPTKGAQVRVHIFLPVLHQGYFGSYSLVNVLCWLASAKLRFPEWKHALVSSRDHKIFSFKRGIWLKTGQRALRTSHCFTVYWWLSEHLISFTATVGSALKCPSCINSRQTELSM